jgi:membrane protein YdbS with pleckstrin-like domain
MTRPEPPDGDEAARRWQDQDTEQFSRPPVDDPSAGRAGAYSGVTAGGAYYVVDEPIPLSEEELAGLRGEPMARPSLTAQRVLPIEDEPSSVVRRYLFPTEKFRGEWKRHWIQLSREIIIGVVATLIMGAATGYLARHDIPSGVTIAIGLWLVVLFVLGWRVGDWWFDRFILTNKRVMLVGGIITRKVAMMPLLRVTDMKYVQSPLGRLLNYGTFELESAGQEQALRKVENLPNPNELYLRIVEEMYEPEAVEARLGRVNDDFGDEEGT